MISLKYLKWLKINPIYFKIIISNHIIENDNIISLIRHWNETWSNIAIQRRVETSCIAWIDKIFSIILLNSVLVSMTVNKHITVKFPLYRCLCFQVTPWIYLMSVYYSDLHVSNCHYLRLRKIAKSSNSLLIACIWDLADANFSSHSWVFSEMLNWKD